MKKLDLTKKHKHYYTASTKPELVEIEEAKFLSLKGKGDPSGSEFSERVQALYATAYTIKFMFKLKDNDFSVAKLEGLWWFDEQKYNGFSISEAPQRIPRSEWIYTLLIRMPEFVTTDDALIAVGNVMVKKKLKLAGEIELMEKTKERVVQMLHVGPFGKEPETLEQIGQFMLENNLKRNGRHHEIYLSDFRKTIPDKLRTILREPVR